MTAQILIASIIGGIMGIVSHIKKRGRLEKPRMTKRFIYLGFYEDFAVGTIAAIMLVLSSEPQSSFQLVLLSIIAGYSGEAVLKSFEFSAQQEQPEGPPTKNCPSHKPPLP
ncbi:DUF4257 domain-containing protein [Metabacillus sp. FJAT-52054]|uniref:DUF4257 domain-containing protein n=1 Tax=Metabacillus sediminis TaxID=3117746 RepID=A0ABZ2NFL5_9BACI